ncbi:hypothetical protein G3495_21505 [Shewanella baltica]|uniref:hypothetical protein n=1 Tax=Shewanella baltica TaxID=62322 RepID=UPI00217D69D7|nr:hypothetical protein [Shewanella baltica]MCS6237662.1 hypothetical protein [Shewanella baltica]MCS6272209.1 hypothetical protein [Shewanella baltica]
MNGNTQRKSSPSVANAVRTAEGFIEITSLDLLDQMVGGMINPEAVFCQLYDEDSIVSQHLAVEGL